MSVARDIRIHFSRPRVDAAAQGLHVFKSLVAEPCGDVEGALAVMAEDSEVFFGIEFLVSAGGDVAHGHKGAGLDVGGGVFPRLADIDEAGLVFAEKSGGVGGEISYSSMRSV